MYHMFWHVLIEKKKRRKIDSGAENGIFEDRRESGTLHEA